MNSLSDGPKLDPRYKLNTLQVLIADGDPRSADLVRQVLFTFGFRRIDAVTNGEAALSALRSKRIDLLICEWGLQGMDGLTLVRTIRSAKNHPFLAYNMPILMLTGQAEKGNVESARDVGTTEFVAKPFSARTLAARVVELIDSPREFIETSDFNGPSRRRRPMPLGGAERRIPREEQLKRPDITPARISDPNTAMADMIGMRAADIVTPEVVNEAQQTLMGSEREFIRWTRDEVMRLEDAYHQLRAGHDPKSARQTLLDAAYVIKSQSGIFGYELGTRVARMLTGYVTERAQFDNEDLTVIGKHIETLTVIFSQQVKDAGGDVGQSLINSLNKLVEKFQNR